METTKLRRFAQYARRTLMELVAARLQLVLQAAQLHPTGHGGAVAKPDLAVGGGR